MNLDSIIIAPIITEKSQTSKKLERNWKEL